MGYSLNSQGGMFMIKQKMDQKAGWFEQIVVSFGFVVVYPLRTLMSEWVEP